MEVSVRRNLFLDPVFQALEKVTRAVVWVDASGNICHLNDEMVKLTGHSAAHLKRSSIGRLEPSLNPRIWEARWDALRKTQVAHWESEFMHASGVSFPVAMQAVQVAMEGQLLACIQVERPNVAASRYDFLSACLSKHKIATWEWDLATNAFYASDFFHEFFGLDKGQQISQENVLHLLKSYLSGKQKEALKQAMDELRKKPVEYEKEIKLRHGVESTILLSVQPCLKQGVPIAIRGHFSAIDTTTENTTGLLSQKMLDCSTDMVFWVNTDLRIQYANQTALMKLGYSKEAITGLQWSEITLQGLGERDRFFKKTETKTTRGIELQGKDGSIFQVKCSIFFVEMNPYNIFFVSAHEVPHTMPTQRTPFHDTLMETVRLSRKLEKESDDFNEELNATKDSILALTENCRNMSLTMGDIVALPTGKPKPVSSLKDIQRQHILNALELSGGKVSGKNGAAELLEINPQTLFSKMRKLGIRSS